MSLCDISFKGTITNKLFKMVESSSLVATLGQVILLLGYKSKAHRDVILG